MRDVQTSDRRLPRHSPRLRRWFARYLSVYFARHFDGVRVAKGGGFPLPLRGSAVVYSNHPSWWDPILYVVLFDTYVPDREGYGPMDAAALERYPFFKRLGAFGVEVGTYRGAVTFLKTAEAILERPGAQLWMTAEGRFTDSRQRPVQIQPGLAHLARKVEELSAVPLAIEYPFWNERRPEALVRFGQPVDFTGLAGRETWSFQRRLEEALEATLDRLAEDATSRDPDRFDTLILGKSGVGGIYDLWRRGRALGRGERYVASHEERRR